MEIIQKGFFCEYEMNVFSKMFFKKDEDVRIITSFEYDEEKINTTTKIEYKDKEYDGSYTYFYKSSDKRKDKIVFRCFVVRSFIQAAQKIKKVNIPWGALSGIRPAKVVRQMYEETPDWDFVKKELKEVFGVSDEKIELAVAVAKKEKKVLENLDSNSVSIYIGIPFCPSRCLYCSFVSSDLRTGKKYVDDYVDLLVEEIKKTAEIIRKFNFTIENIYIGGGTPTSISSEKLEILFKAINDNFDLKKVKEFTLEAGRADTIERRKLEIAKKAGVDRISINPQTMKDETLIRIGRKHDSKMVEDAFLLARDCGFDNINMDLIAGLPGESFEDFKFSLDEVIKLDPENITVHSLCVKRAAALNFTDYELTNYDEMDKMLSYTQEMMKNTKRYPYYMYRQKNISGNLENVGYAKEGYHSFYNINIMEEVQNIIALGGGGVSKLVKGDRIERIFNFKDPCEYIRRFDEIIEKKNEFSNIYKNM